MMLKYYKKPNTAPSIAALEYILRKFGVNEPKGNWNEGVFDLLEPMVAKYHNLSPRRKDWQFLVGHSLRHCAHLYSANHCDVKRLVQEFDADNVDAILSYLPNYLTANFLADIF